LLEDLLLDTVNLEKRIRRAIENGWDQYDA
jgi:hypothetical protein